jgi:hypothetical protein
MDSHRDMSRAGNRVVLQDDPKIGREADDVAPAAS